MLGKQPQLHLRHLTVWNLKFFVLSALSASLFVPKTEINQNPPQIWLHWGLQTPVFAANPATCVFLKPFKNKRIGECPTMQTYNNHKGQNYTKYHSKFPTKKINHWLCNLGKTVFWTSTACHQAKGGIINKSPPQKLAIYKRVSLTSPKS